MAPIVPQGPFSGGSQWAPVTGNIVGLWVLLEGALGLATLAFQAIRRCSSRRGKSRERRRCRCRRGSSASPLGAPLPNGSAREEGLQVGPGGGGYWGSCTTCVLRPFWEKSGVLGMVCL